MAQTEKQFVETYAQLIGLSSAAPSEVFNSVGDYHRVDSLGPSLPALKIDFPTPDQQNASSASSIKLSFKSIKPPFKFSHSFQASSNQSIYKTKTDLISAVDVLKNGHIQPSDIKLLVKGKVYPDTVSLSQFPDPEVSFMCMVSAPSPTNTATGADPDDVPVEKVQFNPKKTISTDTWTRIHELVASDLDQNQATALVSQWKSTV